MLISALLLGGVQGCKVICEECIDCCDKFHGEAYLSGEGHSLSLRRKRRAVGLPEPSPSLSLPSQLVRISGEALLRLCDGDEDGSITWEEYERCTLGIASTRTMQRKFDTLDANRKLEFFQ